MRRYVDNTVTFQKGLTLVELMVALVLGMLLITGVISIFITSKQGYANQDATSQLQENARFSLEMMSREIRMAGYGGCSDAISVANTLDGYSGMADGFENGLQGYEGDASNSTFPASLSAALPNTDAIIIHSVDGNGELSVTEHKPKSATIKLSEAHSIKPGAILILVDANCSNMGIFANTGPTNNNDNATTSNHNEGNIVGYGYKNCTKSLKGDFDCADTSGALTEAYSDGSSLFSANSFAYYVATSTNDPSISSLFRLDIGGASEEMVEGVTDLEIFYGVASGNNLQYRKASSVAANKWADVKSVRLIITASSLTNVSGAPLTKTFTATIKLRNRGESS